MFFGKLFMETKKNRIYLFVDAFYSIICSFIRYIYIYIYSEREREGDVYTTL